MSKKILKRSLALGALMAFVITGSAFANSYHAEAPNWAKTSYRGYIQSEGVATEINGNEKLNQSYNDGTIVKENVVGGWRDISSVDTISEGLNSNITVSGGTWDLVIGGCYVTDYNSASKVDKYINVQSTKVLIENATVKQVAGGTGGSDNWKLEHKGAESSTLIINSGTFGAPSVEGNCPELLVTGGDLLKDGDDETDYWNMGASSSIDTVNTTINNGTFNAAIVGGSSAIQYYGTTGDILNGPCDRLGLNTSVTNVETTINGGTFNHAIIAGGFAYGWYATSKVNDATLNINGSAGTDLNINCDIYAGGMTGNVTYERFGDGKLATIATVDKATINITDATVGDVYGTAAFIKQPNGNNTPWVYSQNANAIVNTTLTLTNVTAETVDIPEGSVILSTAGEGETKIANLKTGGTDKVKVSMIADGTATDALDGDAEAFRNKITLTNVNENVDYTKVKGKMNAGEVVGEVTFELAANGNVKEGSVKEAPHEGNAGVTHNANIALMAWRAETNDMNKRMGELRNANGEHGVWARMVGGEDEFKNAEYEYTQYQLGYDEKLSVDPSWTVGVALSYTDGESNFGKGSGENTHKGLSVYGSKLNDDGSFIDLIAKYSRLEHDLTVDGDEGDYSTNGYSVSAEYGKRFQQGNGLWIEPQVELTYGKVKSAEYKLGQKTVSQDAMESLVGRVGFSLGKDISKGNVYARASYLYDFEGETNMAFTNGATREFAYDLGGGWWEVGVGANINLSKATYIYADVEKTFGGEVDTNWQWNLGVRYSF
ncbi:MAG: autotransporter outer membrane beta-barrel domain-containing protein [Phascolarctobacterium sp.]|nr:autotransporter outer membrane beta-barrel domain-containing protein [Phascolarctobacterium sp.]